MKILAPTFSERYKAQVEAERQYVLNTEHEDTPTSGKRTRHAERQVNHLTSTSTIEEAFHTARTENKNNSAASPQRTATGS